MSCQWFIDDIKFQLAKKKVSKPGIVRKKREEEEEGELEIIFGHGYATISLIGLSKKEAIHHMEMYINNFYDNIAFYWNPLKEKTNDWDI